MKFPSKWIGRLLFAVACLVTLFVLFHVEENWRGERDWNTYKRALQTRGEKLDWASYIPPRVPDEQNFAMTPFLAPLQDFDPATGKLRETDALKRAQGFGKSLPVGSVAGRTTAQCVDLVAWREAMQKPATNAPAQVPQAKPRTAQERAAAAPAVLAALKPYEAVIEELRVASQRPHSRFNLRYESENPIEIQLPHLAPLRNVCKVLALRASAELALGQSEQALADVALVFHIARSTGNDFLIGCLVDIAAAEMAIQVVWEGLANRQWSDAQLQVLQAKFEGMDRLAGVQRALKAERAGFGNALLDYLRRQSRSAWLAMLPFNGDSPAPASRPSFLAAAVSSLIPTGWLYFEQLNYNRCFDDCLFPVFDMAGRRVHPQRARQSEEALKDTGVACLWKHRVLVHLLLPAVNSISRKAAQAQTVADQASLACALERCRLAGGRFPDALDALVPRFVAKLPHDVITGGPLKYRREGDGYALYSVGWNEKDEGGVADAKGDNAQGDWVWQCPAKN
jgi:hypothetical protein